MKPNHNFLAGIPADLSNGRTCETCKHSESGVIHGYPWMTCTKNWSDKQNGIFFGVLKNYCNNHIKKG